MHPRHVGGICLAVVAAAVVPLATATAQTPLVINEILQNPAAVSDSSGEWFELYNPGSVGVDLGGWTIRDDDVDSHVISGSLVVPPGGYVVLGVDDDVTANGGISVDYEYGGHWFLSNSADEIVLLDDQGTQVDRVAYDNGATFPDPNGASMSLWDPALDNAVGEHWCTSVRRFGSGDHGTPGSVNYCVDWRFNEVRVNAQAGDDTGNFIEIVGRPAASLADVSLLSISGEFEPGQIDFAFDLSATVIPPDGHHLVGQRSTYPDADVDTIDADFFHSPQTFMLVTGFTGRTGMDIDNDDDGVLDVTPWDAVVESFSLVDGDTRPDISYSPTIVGPDGSFLPAHAFRCPDARGKFRIGSFFSTADDTPGTRNTTCPPPVPTCLQTPPAVTRIHCIQDDGAATPLPDGTDVVVQAVVTARFEDDDALDGFFVQEEDGDADGNSATSEGIFVFCRGRCPARLAVGDVVTATGRAEEFSGMTQLDVPQAHGTITIDSSGNALPASTPVGLPAAGSTRAEATFEAVEGMVATFPATLVVSEYVQLARFGQIVLTVDERPFQFTHANAPDPAGFAAHLADLATRQIILDDASNDNYDPIAGPLDDEPYPFPAASWPPSPGDGLSRSHTFRGGDTITGLTGVLHWSWAGSGGTDAWRVRPVDGFAYEFSPANPRPASPADVGGDLRVASYTSSTTSRRSTTAPPSAPTTP